MPSQHEQAQSPPPTNLSTLDEYLTEVDALTAIIRQARQDVDSIAELHNASLVALSESDTDTNTKRLETYMAKVKQENNDIKKRIKNLERSNLDLSSGSDLQIRHTQVVKLKKNFIDLIQHYQGIERDFSSRCRQRMERQIRIVNPEISQDELDQIIDSDQQQQVFAQNLMQSNRKGQAKAVLSEVQHRHDDIKKIEKTILELHQLFVDMQTLVEHQGETLDTIEKHAETVVEDLEKGVEHVDKAIQSAKSTRAKKWCCFFIFLILLVVIAILVWWFAFDHRTS
ncbi:t-SNARE [Radiomyces spectabilis]|uniref:t-SNARE n=1 Tax=Radiomyces spectabilis TaxID=64574 RepID=UPI00221F5A70|nr:t-SNARE [Radiomyces spectabilis]KAI8377801.1 t-SNARE [Radiomyces spectabilis]